MVVSDQLYNPATLPHTQKPTISTEREPGWAAEPVWTFRRKETTLTSAGKRTSDGPTCGQAPYRIRYPWPPLTQPTTHYFKSLVR